MVRLAYDHSPNDSLSSKSADGIKQLRDTPTIIPAGDTAKRLVAMKFMANHSGFLNEGRIHEESMFDTMYVVDAY